MDCVLEVVLEIPLLLLAGIVVVLSLISARVQSRLGIPLVLGFILTGIILGPLVFGFIDRRLLDLSPIVTSVALGFIGYNIGNELKFSTIRDKSRRLMPIIIVESFGTALIVFVIMMFWLRDPIPSILLAALSSATAPAATADVIWEFQSRGPLTDAIMYTLILDDVIAIILTSLSLSWVSLILNPTMASLPMIIAMPIFEIGASILLGAGIGLLLAHFLKKVEDYGRCFILLISVIILLIGLAEFLHLSALLMCMVLGIVLGNQIPEETHDLGNEAEKIFSPVILIFFVLFGAQMVDPAILAVGGVFLIVTSLLFVVGRATAKYIGPRVAARFGDNPSCVRCYLGLCLFSQAGVAVGLSIIIADRLSQMGFSHYGFFIVGVIGISTLVFQIIGPLAVKFAIHRAGEVNHEQKGEFKTPVDNIEAKTDYEKLS